MTREKMMVRGELSEKTERELMLEIAINSNLNEKRLRRIINNLLFIVSVIVILIIAYLAFVFLGITL